ncbi:MAG: hypothetical protein HKN58_10155 [Xanthomonadales bacterium]|nr:hypothetical protein [Xanthomonadales bacterium]
MYFIAIFGMLMMVFSIAIIINPTAWAEAIVRFSQWRWFHPFEIVSRLAFGAAFLRWGSETAHPALMQVIGWVLLAVGLGLALTPPSQHRRFAAWSAGAFHKVFRPAGIGSLLFGAFITWSAYRGA